MKPVAFLIPALFISSLAQAGLPRLAPSTPSDAPTGFKREYSDDHMRRNPGQKLDQMFVKVSQRTESDDSQGSWTWMPAEVVGVNRGQYYGNTAGCVPKRDGSLNCFIECDGGSFDLRHSSRIKGAVNFIVTKDYYFPVYRNQMERGETDVETISLDDEANRTFRLVPTDTRECNQAIQKITGEALGGC